MSLLGARLPIVAAPMAGGPTTVPFALAVARGGGFPFLAAGYLTTESLQGQIDQVRAKGHDFGVNLFVPGRSAVEVGSFAQYAARLQREADPYGLVLDPEPVVDDDLWPAKLALLLADPVPVVSLTFGLPSPRDIADLRRAGSTVLASVTTPAEAREAEAAGVDGLIVQGPAAGGHSATFDPNRHLSDDRTAAVVGAVKAQTRLPIVAGGGVDGPEAVAELLAAGAESVAVGTVLLLADEAGTSASYRTALADPRFTETVLTRAFTGRPARALRNGFIDRHQEAAPDGYPAVHHLTRALRRAAADAGDTDRLHLWAGTGWRSARAEPAGVLIDWLAGTAHPTLA